jgi:hypothetical protein
VYVARIVHDFLMDMLYPILLPLGFIISPVRNHMVRICFILVNACDLLWHEPESRTVCSSALDIIPCTHPNLPNCLESPGG